MRKNREEKLAHAMKLYIFLIYISKLGKWE
ncbi:hypothetical protein AGR7B_Cc140091 [Agrobacterium deltaense RV3]|nr:hypothetical protein AGR7B_Cc140091 [Agrobacterium deltaense RV3]